MALSEVAKKYKSKGHRYSEYGRAYYLRTREKQLKYAADKHKDRTLEQRIEDNARRRELSRRPSSIEWRLQHKYGVTLAEYGHVLEAQGGHCALCERRTMLHVDHDHAKRKGEPGFFRGILCLTHNRSIGNLGDNETGLLRALAYVRGERG